jgi:hypothetical protein
MRQDERALLPSTEGWFDLLRSELGGVSEGSFAVCRDSKPHAKVAGRSVASFTAAILQLIKGAIRASNQSLKSTHMVDICHESWCAAFEIRISFPTAFMQGLGDTEKRIQGLFQGPI